MRRNLKLAALCLLVLGMGGLTGCIVVPDDGYGYRHHHWDHDGDRDWDHGGYHGRGDWR